MASGWKVKFCIIPRPLAVHEEKGMRFVGWVWMQRAYLVNNLNHGWMAFVDSQTEENLSSCPMCHRSFAKENQ